MKKLFFLWFLTLLLSLVVWLPFSLSGQMQQVFSNYDGPNFIVVSKCWYHKDCIGQNFSLPLPLEYYPAHFPGYSLLISFFDSFLPGWWAMLAATTIGNLLAVSAFYLILKELKISAAFWLSLISLILPARMMVLRNIGAPESLFIASLLFSILFFLKENYLFAGLFLALGQITKTPAILLFGAYLICLFVKDKFNFRVWLKKWPLLLGPLSILPVFLFFKQQTGNFLAYFYSGDNFHLVFPPFQTFISSRSWLGDFWLEDIIYIYLLGALTVAYLLKKYKKSIIAIFPLVFFLATLFVAHRDISRYSAPLYPFWIIAFADLLKKKEFKIVLIVILIPVYLYTINFITYNTAPIADWTPYF